MSKKPVLRVFNGGPAPDVLEAIASAKVVLRRKDLRAVALITVDCNGVGTLYGGALSGHYHHLVSGAEILKQRVMRDAQ